MIRLKFGPGLCDTLSMTGAAMPDPPNQSKSELAEAAATYLAQQSAGADQVPVRPPTEGHRPTGRETLADAYQGVVEAFGSSRRSPAPSHEVPAQPTPTVADVRRELEGVWDKLGQREADQPEPTPRWPAVWPKLVKGGILLIATVTALYLSLGKPEWLYPPVEGPRGVMTDVEAEQYLVTTAMLVEEFVEEQGRMPVGPAELGLDLGGIAITDQGNGRYEVRVKGPGQTFVLQGRVGGGP